MYRRPSQLASGAVYCSWRCVGLAQRLEKTCPICGVTYAGAKKTCSRACANKNRAGRSYDGENRQNNAWEGRLLKESLAATRGGVCEGCGYTNYRILQVHHVIARADGGSDDLANLKLLCPNCYMESHFGYPVYSDHSQQIPSEPVASGGV